MKKLRILFIAWIPFLSGCSKSNDLIDVEQNLKKTWKLQKYYRNGADETTLLLIKNYEETYAGSNTYSRSYLDKNNNPVSENGTWNYESSQKRLNISSVSSIELTVATGTVSSAYHTIIRLGKDEFWYYFINGSDRHEFRFFKKI
jgi:hypothetical protein